MTRSAMARYTFIKEKDFKNVFDSTKVTVEIDCVSLNEVLEAFEDFLKGSGFILKGKVEIIEDEND
jgi:hypothetical protein